MNKYIIQFIIISILYLKSFGACDTAQTEMTNYKTLNCLLLLKSTYSYVSFGNIRNNYFRSRDTCFIIEHLPNDTSLRFLSPKIKSIELLNKGNVKDFINELFSLYNAVNKIKITKCKKDKSDLWNVEIHYESVKWENYTPTFTNNIIEIKINNKAEIMQINQL
jgi:hypothetical protein